MQALRSAFARENMKRIFVCSGIAAAALGPMAHIVGPVGARASTAMTRRLWPKPCRSRHQLREAAE